MSNKKMLVIHKDKKVPEITYKSCEQKFIETIQKFETIQNV